MAVVVRPLPVRHWNTKAGPSSSVCTCSKDVTIRIKVSKSWGETKACYYKGNLKSGKGNSYVYSFSNHYSVTNIYFNFYIFLPKRFEAT